MLSVEPTMITTLDLVKEIGSQGLLAIVLISLLLPLVKEVRVLNQNIAKLIAHHTRSEEHYAEVLKGISTMKAALTIAFSGSSVDSYRLAGKLLKGETNEQLR